MGFRIFIFLLLFLSFHAHSETLKIVTGEYAPYVGENLPDGGISTRVVRAAFEESKVPVNIEFIPWNRAMNSLLNGVAAGSYPWTKNPDREKDFLYSDILHKYRIISFVKKNSLIAGKFIPEKKKVCLPSGWDETFIVKGMAKFKMTFERPINIESCFQMLALGRVDVIPTNEHVGMVTINKLYPEKSPFAGIESDVFEPGSNLYFIVPKKTPNAQGIIADFNRGLMSLKKSGKYDLLVKDLIFKSGARSSCGICSRLGSL